MDFIKHIHTFLESNIASLNPLNHIYAFKPNGAAKPFAYIENLAISDFSSLSFKGYQFTLPIVIEGIYRDEDAGQITESLIELLDNADIDMGADYQLINLRFSSVDYKYSNKGDLINIKVSFVGKVIRSL